MALQQLCCQGPPDWTTRLEAITSHVSSPAPPPVQAESAAADPRPSALLRKFSVSYDESMCATCPPLATAAPATVLHSGGQRSFIPPPPTRPDPACLWGVGVRSQAAGGQDRARRAAAAAHRDAGRGQTRAALPRQR